MSVQIKKFIHEDLDLDVIVDENDNLLFFAEQVTRSLGYNDPDQAIQRHVKEKYRIEFKDLEGRINSSLGFHPHKLLIKEPAFYSLVFNSKHPQAIKFQRWVLGEVIPQILITGKYTEKEFKPLRKF